MTIRVSVQQRDAFDEGAVRGFHRRLREYLRSDMTTHVAQIDDAKLDVFINECHRRAEKAGISTESGITQWTCLTVIVREHLDEVVAFMDYLNDLTTIPESKDDRLELLVDCLATLEPGDESMLGNLIAALSKRAG